MLEYSDFYDIAEYGNKMWKGSFTQKEIACNAYDYMYEHEESMKKGKLTRTIKELCKLLIEDGSEECLNWVCNIATDNKVMVTFYVYCFERFLNVMITNIEDEQRTKELMQIAYDTWAGDETDELGDVCCEEYICEQLKENGIDFYWIPTNLEEEANDYE